jgi:hypothetical protein
MDLPYHKLPGKSRMCGMSESSSWQMIRKSRCLDSGVVINTL